jgi:hypothetical protein
MKKQSLIDLLKGKAESARANLKDKLSYGEKELDKYLNLAVDLGEKYTQKVKQAYSVMSNRLFPNGELDLEEVRKTLKNKQDAVRTYGLKAYKDLEQLVERGLNQAQNKIDEYLPAEEDFKPNGRYNGIGTEYEGILFKKHYESCLTFYKTAEEKLPARSKYRASVLADIKSSASENADELTNFYLTKARRDSDNRDEYLARLKVLDYLENHETKS